MGSRKSRQVETRLVVEYLKDRYSSFSTITKQPLGAVSEELLKQEGYKRGMGIARPFRPEVDAIVILPRHLIVIEAKVWKIVDGLAKLPLYKSLVPHTPELKEYMPRDILMQLVVGWSNTNLQIMANELGVQIRVYCPPWLQKVVDDMHKYWTPEYRQAREDKLRMREYYGIE